MKPSATGRFSVRFVYAVVRKRAPTFAFIFALLFSLIAIAQYLFVRHGVYNSAEAQLQQWTQQVKAEIDYKDKWDLKPLRQSEDIEAAHAFVFTTDGTVVQMNGFIPGLVGQVRLLDDSIFAEPKTVTVEETDETWREFAVKVKGGTVALGIWNPQDISAPDNILRSAAHEFGTTLEDALKVTTRQTSSQLDYAVIDDSGNLLIEVDWFPLQVDPRSVSELANTRGVIRKAGKSFLLASSPILDSHGKQVGTIIVPKEVTGEEHVIRQHILFNAAATLACWLAALIVVVVFLAVDDWRRRPRAASLEEALKDGESQSVEFKEGHADVPLRKAIAAFANTNCGTIFLGIDNHARVVGINCDKPNEKDLELQRIRNITAEMIRPAIPVAVDFLLFQGKTVVRIFVPRGDHPLYFLDHQIYVRDQTASMIASPAHVEEILKKFNR